MDHSLGGVSLIDKGTQAGRPWSLVVPPKVPSTEGVLWSLEFPRETREAGR